MKTIKATKIIEGYGEGEALVTRMPVNFTAGFTKVPNFLPFWKDMIMDRHHDLFRKRIKDRVLVFPACIGSTGTGLVLMHIINNGSAPAAMIVQDADSLLVSGVVLSDVWFKKKFPVVEYRRDDIYDEIRTNDRVGVDGTDGTIHVMTGSR